MDEREVNLKEVLKRIILSWRFLLIWILLGTILSGATGIIKVRQAVMQQNQVLQEMIEEIDGGVETEESKEPMDPVNMLLKYLIIGMVMGGFVSSGWIVCRCFFAATILCTEDVESAFTSPILGQVVENQRSKKFLSGIDEWIRRLFQRKGCSFSTEECIRMIVTRIRVYTKKQEINHVYITGSANSTAATQLKTYLFEKLKEEKIEVSYGNSPVCNPESLEQMDACDAVVFVEQVDVSRYDDMKEEVMLCKQCRVPVMGYVVLK
jgi:hypothetical protein